MTKEIRKANKAYYQCENCKFFYKEKSWAEKCEKWCDEKGSCNVEVVRYAVKII